MLLCVVRYISVTVRTPCQGHARYTGGTCLIELTQLEAILPRVEKPARYIGGELNSVVKNVDIPIHFLFAFPDCYEVGMSHLGTTILYHLTLSLIHI